MWSELRADASVYTALRWPGGAGAVRRALIWVLSPGLLILVVHRMSHAYRARRQRYGWTFGTIALRTLCAVGSQLLVFTAKSDAAATIVIGRGVYLSDRGYLILGAKRIGSGTLIHERVTIGARAGEQALPVIGENVWIGPDCVIYGDSTLGDGATVLSGSVLSMTVPAGAVVGGNPATIVLRDFDNSALRQTLANNFDRESLAPQ
jgi:serine O-acetyltransferase